jgi:DNA-binding CsgD family transcriptional regulator
VNATAAALDVVTALHGLQDGPEHALTVPEVAQRLRAAIPADAMSLNDLDLRQRRAVAIELLEWHGQTPPEVFWLHFMASRTCSYTETDPRLRREVMCTSDFYADRQWHSTGMYNEWLRPAEMDQEMVIPLPGPPGVARRLVFFRQPGRPFSDADRAAAVLLQTHLAEAVRSHARRESQQRLTPRQVEMLRQVAAGREIIAIARDLGLSPGTVRKHLENAYARLQVTSRAAAVAQAFPDIAWV